MSYSHSRFFASSLLLCATLLQGCGSDNSTSTATFNEVGSLTIVEPDDLSRDGDTPDSVEVEAFDAAGQLIFGPTVLPFSNGQFAISGLPSNAARLQLDYLRNEGFILFRSDFPIDQTQGVISNPDQKPAQNTTAFDLVEGPNGFNLQETIDGDPITLLARQGEGVRAQMDSTFKIKGVCYAPGPINYSNKDAPAFGDLFWDEVEEGGVTTLFNWRWLWDGPQDIYIGELGGTFKRRGDLERIRALGCNSLRTYSTIARQIRVDGTVPPPKSGTFFHHKEFLDKCWNNGNKPLRVLVGIPMPSSCFYRYSRIETEVAFWESNLEETVKDLAGHPAVLGFTVFNEYDENRSAFPAGGANADSDYYYGQVKKYTDLAKTLAPDKLVGWAGHDFSGWVPFATNQPSPGPSYFEQLTSVDFYGVNTYQTQSLSSIFSPGNPDAYGSIEGAARKPVLFTEMGWPATGHRDPSDPDSIYDDELTRQKTAVVITDMVDKALKEDLCAGMFYFEYSDEWWKQDVSERDARGTKFEWNGTRANPVSFPNGYWDEEGFGLYSVRRGTPPGDFRPLPNDTDPWNGVNGPRLPVDDHIERKEMTRALREAYERFPDR